MGSSLLGTKATNLTKKVRDRFHNMIIRKWHTISIDSYTRIIGFPDFRQVQYQGESQIQWMNSLERFPISHHSNIVQDSIRREVRLAYDNNEGKMGNDLHSLIFVNLLCPFCFNFPSSYGAYHVGSPISCGLVVLIR